MGQRCSSAETQVCHRSYIIAARIGRWPYMNVHWMVLYKLYVFCSDMKFKMAATAGLSLTFDPMGKMFQNAFSLKPLRQLKPSCPGMIIGRSSTKFLSLYADQKFKMSATARHRLTLDLMENVQMPSSQKLQI